MAVEEEYDDDWIYWFNMQWHANRGEGKAIRIAVCIASMPLGIYFRLKDRRMVYGQQQLYTNIWPSTIYSNWNSCSKRDLKPLGGYVKQYRDWNEDCRLGWRPHIANM